MLSSHLLGLTSGHFTRGLLHVPTCPAYQVLIYFTILTILGVLNNTQSYCFIAHFPHITNLGFNTDWH